MSDSHRSLEGPSTATCADCGALYRVQSVSRTYTCKKCGGVVTAEAVDDDAFDDDEATADQAPEPEHPTHTPEERRLHAAHVAQIAQEREQRKKYARAHKDVENVLNLIGNILWASLFAAAFRLVGFGLALFDYAATGEMAGSWNLSAVILFTVLSAVDLAMLVLMKRKLRQAPVAVAGVIAGYKVLIASLALWDMFGTMRVGEGISWVVVAAAAVIVFFTLFHVYAFFALKKNREMILHLRQVRGALSTVP